MGPRTEVESDPNDLLIGTGHGLDHILIVVKDLARASQDFEERLGFVIERGSRFASGVENKAISLHEHEYLELISIYDRRTGHPDIAEIEQFLSQGEGIIGFGIRTSSAERTASHLRQEGFQVEGPKPGTTTYPGIDEAPPTLWKYVQVRTGQKCVDDVIFFVEYVEGAYRGFRSRHPELPDTDAPPPAHPNSAFASLHPWLASTQPEEAASAYEKVGFPVLRRAKFDSLKGDAVEVRIGRNSLVIVGSATSGGPIEGFLRQRETPYGLIGLSLGVQSLARALASVQYQLGAELEPKEGLFGRSVVVPPEFARGIWLELFEPTPSRG